MPKIGSVEAYPLCWPEGWKRTAVHVRRSGYQFKGGDTYGWRPGTTERVYVGRRQITPDRARKLLVEELERLKARAVIISSNVPLRADGEMRADAATRRYDDPGVAVYFQFKGKPMVMACDAYDNIASNLRSLGLAIEALRQLERHGGGVMMERAFAGFSALPPPEGAKPRRPWWEVMRYSDDPEEREMLSAAEIEARYRAMANKLHPDHGGSDDAMAELNAAKEEAIAEIVR